MEYPSNIILCLNIFYQLHERLQIFMKFLSFISHLLDYIYYRKCYLCAKKCTGSSICPECLQAIYDNFSFQRNKVAGLDIYTGAVYEENLLKIIRALKYHKKRDFAIILSDIIFQCIKNFELDIKDFIICPVPIHNNRLKKRKYNHMELVGAELSKALNIEIRSDFLKREKDTAPLYKLTIPERKAAIDCAFIASEEIKGKKILLIDDIITSGTTIKELSNKIFEQQPKELIIISATRSKSFV